MLIKKSTLYNMTIVLFLFQIFTQYWFKLHAKIFKINLKYPSFSADYRKWWKSRPRKYLRVFLHMQQYFPKNFRDIWSPKKRILKLLGDFLKFFLNCHVPCIKFTSSASHFEVWIDEKKRVIKESNSVKTLIFGTILKF